MRSSPLKRTPMKATRPKPTIPAALRKQLEARSEGWCEAALPGCTNWATDACHRKARKDGGRPLGDDARLSNLWHGCRACHRWATGAPTEAYDLGLALREHQDPSSEPFPYRDHGLVLLDDLGFMWPYAGSSAVAV